MRPFTRSVGASNRVARGRNRGAGTTLEPARVEGRPSVHTRVPVGVAAVQLLALLEESGPAGLIHLITSERRAENIGRCAHLRARRGPERAFAPAFKRLDGALTWTGERMFYKRSSDTADERSALVRELLEELP